MSRTAFLLGLLFIFLLGCRFPGSSPTSPPAALTPTPEATAEPTLGKVALIRSGDLWVLDLHSGVERRLTQDGRNRLPRWSSDGRWIAFLKPTGRRLGELWVIRPDGSEARQIEETLATKPSWSPLGSQLAYATEDGALWLVNLEGPQRLQILPPGSGVTAIAWAPDGKRLALELWELKAGQRLPVAQGLWLISADGSGLTQLYSSYDPAQNTWEVYLGGWSPDGKHLTFWEGRFLSPSFQADGLRLFILPLSGGEPRLVGRTLVFPDFLAWSPQGDRLVFVEGGPRETWLNKQMAAMVAVSGERIALSQDMSRAELSPVWSPDGGQIAFVSGPSGLYLPEEFAQAKGVGARRLWVMKPDGTERRQLTEDPSYSDERPLWSADGTHLLFVRRHASPRGAEWQVELWLIGADGSNQRQVAVGLSPPVPSPPGLSTFGYYGRFAWEDLFDWWQPRRRPAESR